MIPAETIRLVEDTARIEDVIGDFLSLKRRGASLVACCPFHNEKTPSFYVTPSRAMYKCFGCGAAGGVFKFVMEHEHCSYTEAVKYVARKYNIEVREREETAEDIALRQHSESLMLVSEFAQKFFASQLSEGEGRTVGLAYFHTRGLEDATIAKFGLGWAPSGRTALLDAAVKAGYKVEYLLDAGLCVRHEDGSVVDKFRERVMFPIHSVSGRVIAFSGRTLRSDNPAKYLNSPETEIYTKSRILLGIYFAKNDIHRLRKCILVEGNVDMVTLHQLGITNVVASCGTSLTVEQVRLIHKHTDNLTIMYDGDSAGIHAAMKGIGLALQEGLDVKVVLLPDGEDPDSFARKHTLAQMQEFIDGGERDFIGFKTDLLLGEAGSDPLRRANLINDIADTIADIPDAVKRSVYVEDCARKFDIDPAVIFRRVSQTRRGTVPPTVKVEKPSPVQYVPENRVVADAERDIVELLLRYGGQVLEFPSDSEYYVSEEDKILVRDFISESLETDGVVMQNSVYRRLYDEYFELAHQGRSDDEIVRALVNLDETLVADAAAQLSSDKYSLSVKNLSSSMMTVPSWLIVQVPKALLYYMERRVYDELLSVNRSIAEDPDNEALLLRNIELKKLQTMLRRRIGRERKQ
ncbi:MAG: DNA primase [Bacteroidales bacterium]|nr:DNA primase [Bacteroidales bacterium]